MEVEHDARRRFYELEVALAHFGRAFFGGNFCSAFWSIFAFNRCLSDGYTSTPWVLKRKTRALAMAVRTFTSRMTPASLTVARHSSSKAGGTRNWK
jgi:hypothetical protein